MIKLDSGFEVLRYSDDKYERITAEIGFQGEPVAQLNMDKGLDKIEVELITQFSDASFVPKFPIADFLDAITEAKNVLEQSWE